MSKPSPTLVLAWGNRARGDDALGPLFADRLRALALPGVEVLEEHQLMPEHALDLIGRESVLFVDASATATPPFECHRVQAAPAGWGLTTHAMAPAALLAVFERVNGGRPPPCFQLAIRGEHFGLGDALGSAAAAHLGAALDWAVDWLAGESEGPRDRRAFEKAGGDSEFQTDARSS